MLRGFVCPLDDSNILRPTGTMQYIFIDGGIGNAHFLFVCLPLEQPCRGRLFNDLGEGLLNSAENRRFLWRLDLQWG